MATEWRPVPYGTWWGATHAPSASKIQLKRWNARHLVDAGDCEAAARTGNPAMPTPPPSALVLSKQVSVLQGFSGAARVYSWRDPNGINGAVLMVAFQLRECLVLSFSTHASGAAAPSTVADSLATAFALTPSLEPLTQQIAREPQL